MGVLVERLFNGLARFKNPSIDRVVLEAHLSAQSLKRDDIAVILNKNGIPFVKSLFLYGGPSAVFWAIITVWVNSINGVLLAWPLPHVIKKISKNLPSLANGDASSTVIVPVRFFGIGASFNHTGPNIVYGLPAPTVHKGASPSKLRPVATTGNPFSTRKIKLFNLKNSSAIAPAIIEYSIAAFLCQTKNQESVNLCANEFLVRFLKIKEFHAAK